jgi:hypothetical protein
MEPSSWQAHYRNFGLDPAVLALLRRFDDDSSRPLSPGFFCRVQGKAGKQESLTSKPEPVRVCGTRK